MNFLDKDKSAINMNFNLKSIFKNHVPAVDLDSDGHSTYVVIKFSLLTILFNMNKICFNLVSKRNKLEVSNLKFFF